MNMIQKPKGTYDVYGEMGRKLRYVEQVFSALMERYDYEYVATPLFEQSNLFHRSVGDSSDIVRKETYDFKDRGDRMMTLRPEGTAGVVRSYIENKMYGDIDLPKKLWYFGSMFRYERPQAGRYREFRQLGVEVLGSPDPMMDAEIISIPVNLFRLLGLEGVKVRINSLGDQESRNAYREALKDYFRPHLGELCHDCNERFETNPLRILDCKVDGNTELMKNAPKMEDYLNEESKKHFEKVKEYLDALNIVYEVNPNLVRGLDYYTHTVFEVEASVEGFGSQNVLCGGGRYDLLVETLDGPHTPAVGFALGIERLLTALDYEELQVGEEKELDIYVIPLSDEDKGYVIGLSQALRLSGFSVDVDSLNRSMKSNFKQADRKHSRFVMIIGESERENNLLTIKDNHTKQEYKVTIDEIIDFLDEHMDSCDCDDCHDREGE